MDTRAKVSYAAEMDNDKWAEGFYFGAFMSFVLASLAWYLGNK